MKIVIPTFKRSDDQIFYNYMPEKFRKNNVILVIQEQEKDLYNEYECEKFVLPFSLNNGGIANTRQYIVDYLPEDKIIMSDDDNFIKKRFFDKEDKPRFYRIESEEDWGEFLKKSSDYLDEAYHIGFNFPSIAFRGGKKDYNENSRYMRIVGYNLSKLRKEINFNFLKGEPSHTTSEDIFANIDLLLKGYPNRIYNTYCVDSKNSWGKGGCSDFRTIESNNKCNMILKSIFPNLIRLNKKKDGKVDCVVQWKKAYNLSLNEEKTFTLF